MTFPVDYDNFTILSKVRNYFTIRIFRRANIAHKPTSSFGGYFSSVTHTMSMLHYVKSQKYESDVFFTALINSFYYFPFLELTGDTSVLVIEKIHIYSLLVPVI